MGHKKTIVFAIPSFNEADSIGALTQIIDRGLTKYYPEFNSIILNVDNNSPDGTKKAFLNTPTKNRKVYLSSKGKPKNLLGKGYHMKMALKFALNNNAAVLGFIDGDVESATTEWVKLLLEPVLKKKADHVLPVYLRNDLDASITNHLAYPVLYGLLGADIRQPLAGEVALSPKAMQTFLKSTWTHYAYHYGVDILWVSESIFHGLKISQIFIGVKKHKPSAPKLDNMFIEVAGSLINQLKIHRKYINNSPRKRMNVSRAQTPPKKLLTPTLHFNYETFKTNVEKKYGLADKLSSSKWAEKVFGTILKKSNLKNIEVLRRQFFMRFLTYFNEIKGKPHEEAEKNIVNQAKIFRKLRNKTL